MKINLFNLAGWSFLAVSLLSACSADTSGQQAEVRAPIITTQDPPKSAVQAAPESAAALAEAGWAVDEARIDEQGAVSVEITPLNLNAPGLTLDFSVALNTHSVDLSMDLTALAVLLTDKGQEMQASSWDAPQGGHHIQGLLQFPANKNGVNLMDGAQQLTLVIRGLDAPERIFVWGK